jgi:pimeloyl-ACP methyl ester carboxylesterase
LLHEHIEEGIALSRLADEACMSEFHLSHRGIVEFFNAIIGNPTSESAPYRAHRIAAYGEEGARRTTQSFSRAIASIIANGGDISLSKAHRIRCPTLLITGEDDAFASPALVEAYAGRLPDAEKGSKGSGPRRARDPRRMVRAMCARLALRTVRAL